MQSLRVEAVVKVWEIVDGEDATIPAPQGPKEPRKTDEIPESGKWLRTRRVKLFGEPQGFFLSKRLCEQETSALEQDESLQDCRSRRMRYEPQAPNACDIEQGDEGKEDGERCRWLLGAVVLEP